MEFRSVVCGVDGTPAGLVAADRAARIVTAAGLLSVVGVDEVTVVGGAMPPAPVVVQHASQARRAVDEAVASIAGLHGNVRTTVAEGTPTRALLDEVEARAGDLVVVGTHGTRRVMGILLGSTATYALHDMPCSVLVARDGRRDAWPGSIVVGIDGSEPSLEAYRAASGLASHFGASLRALASAKASDPRTLDRLRAAVERLEETEDEPVVALVAASGAADLVVVGSRGLTGVRALGSVSERVAHESACSVLVVRRRPS